MSTADKQLVVVDPHFRRMQEIFSPEDVIRLHDTVEVVWGQDQPMPADIAGPALRHAIAVVCSGWPYGAALEQALKLQAIIDVGGGFPSGLDYELCFTRRIRVLTCAPAFAPQVAEMALGLALATSRDIVVGDRAMRAGAEGWTHTGNIGTFLLCRKPVGFIGFGSLAQAVRSLLAPFECPIAVYDPWLSAGYLKSAGVTPLAPCAGPSNSAGAGRSAVCTPCGLGKRGAVADRRDGDR